ncbi:MAG TPA: hypothetical protein VG187_06045 [Mycobacterium sp.]|nr:hypothetical protein [Mycobacterium sp.]
MWCADSSLITIPQDTDITLASGDVSDHPTTIECHVTQNRLGIPIGPLDTAWARIARFLVPKHPRGGRACPPHRWREYLEPSSTSCAPAAHGGTSRTTSP